MITANPPDYGPPPRSIRLPVMGFSIQNEPFITILPEDVQDLARRIYVKYSELLFLEKGFYSTRLAHPEKAKLSLRAIAGRHCWIDPIRFETIFTAWTSTENFLPMMRQTLELYHQRLYRYAHDQLLWKSYHLFPVSRYTTDLFADRHYLKTATVIYHGEEQLWLAGRRQYIACDHKIKRALVERYPTAVAAVCFVFDAWKKNRLISEIGVRLRARYWQKKNDRPKRHTTPPRPLQIRPTALPDAPSQQLQASTPTSQRSQEPQHSEHPPAGLAQHTYQHCADSVCKKRRKRSNKGERRDSGKTETHATEENELILPNVPPNTSAIIIGSPKMDKLTSDKSVRVVEGVSINYSEVTSKVRKVDANRTILGNDTVTTADSMDVARYASLSTPKSRAGSTICYRKNCKTYMTGEKFSSMQQSPIKSVLNPRAPEWFPPVAAYQPPEKQVASTVHSLFPIDSNNPDARYQVNFPALPSRNAHGHEDRPIEKNEIWVSVDSETADGNGCGSEGGAEVEKTEEKIDDDYIFSFSDDDGLLTWRP